MRNMTMNVKNYLMRKGAEAFAVLYSPKLKKMGSAVIAEVILIVVVLALAVAYKTGGLSYISDLWTEIATKSKSIWN